MSIRTTLIARSRRIAATLAAVTAGVTAIACSDTTGPQAPARTIASSSAKAALATGVNTIVFERDSASQGFIYTMNDDGTSLTRVGAGSQPAWSPDHSKIAFAANNTVFVMNADGSGAKQVGIALDRFPSFTADGAKVVFAHENAKGDMDVFTVDVDGTNRQLLLKLGGASAQAPRISPDGTKLAVQVTRRNDSDIIVVDLATGRRTVVADSATRETVPAWSPDSKRLAYLTGILNKGRCIAVVNADGTGTKLFTNDLEHCSSVSWSPDGKELGFTSTFEGTEGIYRAPVDVSAAPTRLTTPLAGKLDLVLSWAR
jgi:Tol biopolymer transport system component